MDLWRGLVHGRTSLYPADTLGKPDVIVVSMSHWMGGFGFFIHPALLAETLRELHGNFGYVAILPKNSMCGCGTEVPVRDGSVLVSSGGQSGR